MRRRAPAVLVALGLVALLASYVWYTQRIRSEMRREAAGISRIFARIFDASTDTSVVAAELALFDVKAELRALGVPIMVTDAAGVPTAAANTPFDSLPGDPRARELLVELDRQNAPVRLRGGQVVHFGDSPFVVRMRVVPLVQLGALVALLLAGVAVLRSRSRAEREQLWAGMARESAHQLGTPLSSLQGWIELLREAEPDGVIERALPQMQGDIERLERVAHRFERIGRPPKRDPVDVGDVAQQVVGYFASRLPTLAHAISIRVDRPDGPLTVAGDRVLIEWALESLVKNAIDALAGRGGAIVVEVATVAGSGVRARVKDDGPGIPRELRSRIFAPGFTTKERGWGLGLALTRRIVEENHAGRVALVPSDRGAVFDIIFPG